MGAKTHGLRTSPEYMVWARMKARCNNPNNPKYYRYGGRGISVCARWEGDFAAFYADMGAKPSPAHSLDRIDNDKGYTPENCQWALPAAQANNRSTTRTHEYRGFVGTRDALAKHTGVPSRLLKFRLDLGWDIARAIETPSHADERHVTLAGKTQSLSAWGRETGLGGACISERLRAGWPVEAALTLPKKPGRGYKQEIA
jgi:hypothetical protein